MHLKATPLSLIFLVLLTSKPSSSIPLASNDVGHLQKVLDEKFAALNAAVADGDAIHKEVESTSKELEEAEKAVEAALVELEQKDEDLIQMGLELKETRLLKDALESQTATLEKDLADVKTNLNKAVTNLEGLGLDHDLVKNSSVLARSEAEACYEWSSSIATAKVELEDRVGTLERAQSKLLLEHDEIKDQLLECAVSSAKKDDQIKMLDQKVRSAEEQWDMERASFSSRISSLDSQVRRITSEASSKDTRISVLEKTLAHRTIATKKAEASAVKHADENRDFRAKVADLESELEKYRTLTQAKTQEVSEMTLQITNLEAEQGILEQHIKEVEKLNENLEKRKEELEASELSKTSQIVAFEAAAFVAQKTETLLSTQTEALLAETLSLRKDALEAHGREKDLSDTIESLRTAALEDQGGDKSSRFWQMLESLNPAGEVLKTRLKNGIIKLTRQVDQKLAISGFSSGTGTPALTSPPAEEGGTHN